MQLYYLSIGLFWWILEVPFIRKGELIVFLFACNCRWTSVARCLGLRLDTDSRLTAHHAEWQAQGRELTQTRGEDEKEPTKKNTWVAPGWILPSTWRSVSFLIFGWTNCGEGWLGFSCEDIGGFPFFSFPCKKKTKKNVGGQIVKPSVVGGY